MPSTKVRAFFLLLALLLAPFQITAASASARIVLVFADDETQLALADPAGKTLVAQEGMVVPPGTTIRTKDTTAELRLEPNGSVLKIARNTVFRIQALQNIQGASSSDFVVLGGKIRMIAAKVAGLASAYNVITPMAQAAVRGTDFAVEANAPEGDWICVKEGAVEFALLTNGSKGASVLVSAGEFANAKAPKFAARKASEADIADKFSGLDLVAVKEAEVPGHAAP